MQTMTDMVMDFHKLYNAYISEKPELRDKDIAKLRIKLLDEELNEYKEAVYTNNLVEIADALGDIIYVAIGAAISYGIPMEKVFAEIHRSNMDKLDENGNPIINEYGKVVKPSWWQPPDLKTILIEHGANI